METVALQAVLQKLQEQQTELVAVLGRTQTLTQGFDIVVFETFERDVSADSAVQKVGLQPLEARGTLQQTLTQSVSVEGRIVFRRLIDFVPEGLLQKQSFISLGMSTYLKHVVACWQRPSGQSETWDKAEGKDTSWVKNNAKGSAWDSEEESPNGCNSFNS